MNRIALVALVLTWVVLYGGPLLAAPPQDVDTSRWRCRFCPDPGAGVSGSVRAGAGYVNENAVKFGEHNGLTGRGAFLDAAAEVSWNGTAARYWKAVARDLDLGTRSLTLEGGEQGRYEISFLRDSLVDHDFDNSLTPFLGIGGGDLTLPGGWVRATAADGMEQLRASLSSVDVESRRHRTGLGVRLEDAEHWSYYVGYRHERRDGERVAGAAFLVDSAELLAPADYRSHAVDAGVRYERDAWHVEAAYYGSLFRNEHDALTWENPFSAVAPGADRGTLALAPDNQFHRLSLSGSGRLASRFHLSGTASIGYQYQDDDLLEPTANAALLAPLPRRSAEAEATVLSVDARLRYDPPVAGLTTSLDYRAEVRDNDTEIDAFTQVVTDTFTAGVVRNQPLSWTRHTLSGSVRYRFDSAWRLAGGVAYERYDRDYGADPSTDEYRIWGEMRSRLGFGELKLELKHADRDASGVEPVAAGGTPQNPLMRWFDVADRDEQSVRVTLTVFPAPWAEITVTGQSARSDYDQTRIGRTRRWKQGYGIEGSATIGEHVNAFGYALRSVDRTDQRNSQVFGPPDWRGEADDDYATVGFGVRFVDLIDRLDLEIDLTYSDAESDNSVDLPGLASPLPEIEDERYTARLGADYRLADAFSLVLGLTYETLRRNAWQLDEVGVDTVPGFLTLGRSEPEHDVLVMTVSARYRF